MWEYTDNVILARARALYGSRLKPEDFTALLGCHTVAEIAAWLKNRTSYVSVLGAINEANIHRGYLETLLRRKIRNDYASLCRYGFAGGRRLADYLIHREEIGQIISCLRLMSAGRPEEYFYEMPLFLLDTAGIDFVKMSRAASFSELVEALGDTAFARTLQKYPPLEDGTLRIREIENELYRGLTEEVYDTLSDTSGELREQLLDLLGTQGDTQNVTRIVRMKRYFQSPPEEIEKNLLPWSGLISVRVRERMVEAVTAEEVLSLFFATPAGRRIPDEQRGYTHDLYHRAPFYSARHYIRYSVHPMVTLISYIIASDMELNNIINIIEGIRYGMTPEEIRPVLVLAD
ncbi:MAG: V-type ATPase subunit [Clostridiales bacterium]|nr:V-type ATPase subunit [Clostridiales bacterium]